MRGAWVNIHLLVSPEDDNHVAELRRFLARLTFDAFNDRFSCSQEDLIRLGHRADPSLIASPAALEHGSTQFKVSLEQLQREYKAVAWAQENILIAVAANSQDGTSGVRDGADKTLRQEIEKFAHIIFASGPTYRDFWLGRRDLSPEEVRQRYGGLKPCLHGCDAHDLGRVGLPEKNRFSWVKGAIHLDTLRQAVIEPEGRVYVGESPPMAATPSQVIHQIEINGAPWITTPSIELNPGLVAIVGARGSGKTALADIIAMGCGAIPEAQSRNSFLTRAKALQSPHFRLRRRAC